MCKVLADCYVWWMRSSDKNESDFLQIQIAISSVFSDRVTDNNNMYNLSFVVLCCVTSKLQVKKFLVVFHITVLFLCLHFANQTHRQICT